jgi:uncharacterized protein YneF (UPF0154 family)
MAIDEIFLIIFLIIVVIGSAIGFYIHNKTEEK